ncbi:hypothetical protein [Clostridium butyricum]|uniref:hypothetical protein n=1 Tax=Clostridium butyricum TaxID=1492 RepID=UPI0022E02C6C|nr:hypothetical protein [Clostridium butyricum]
MFRGVGKLHITFIATSMQIFVKVVLSYMISPYLGILSVYYAIAIGWILMIIYQSLVYKKYFREIKESNLSNYNAKYIEIYHR